MHRRQRSITLALVVLMTSSSTGAGETQARNDNE